MNVQKRNGVSIYCLSSGPGIPEWLGEQGRRNLAKRDESVRRRIELIQDFTMPSSSSRLVQSPDGQYIVAAGIYPPRIRCFDVDQLTMKFERYLNASVVDMLTLSSDFGKLALLLDDRTISFHAPYGAHESVRIPTFGRAMAYEPTTCDLLVAAQGSQIYRLNLQEGRFVEPWAAAVATSDESLSATCIAVHPSYPLATVGWSDGTLSFWDNRAPDTLSPFLTLDVKGATAGYVSMMDTMPGNHSHKAEITAVAHDPAGLYMAVGTRAGSVALYDVRSSRPLHVQEHKHGSAIHTVRFHTESGCVLSGDEQIIKIWRYKSASSSAQAHRGWDADDVTDTNENHTDSFVKRSVGSLLVNVQGNAKLHHFIVSGDEKEPTGKQSGLILCATDQPKMDSFFVPALGMAPRWCSFLENITEELQERDLQRASASISTGQDELLDGHEAVFENYKFVSREDLDQLGVSHLIGTPMLRGYMHGFFMDLKLYNRVKAVANPFEYEAYQKRKLKERLASKQASRIAPKSKPGVVAKPAVNAELADRLQERAKVSVVVSGGRTSAKKKSASSQAAQHLLSDPRFGGLFTNPDFTIDESDENFKLRNPSGVAAVNRQKKDEEDDSDQDIRYDDDDDDENVDALKDRGQAGRYVGESIALDNDEGDFEEDEHDLDQDEDDDEDSEEDGFKGGRVRGEAYKAMKEIERGVTSKKRPDTKKNKETANSSTSGRSRPAKSVRLEELDRDGDQLVGDRLESAAERTRKRLEEMHMPLLDRLGLDGNDGQKVNSKAGLWQIRSEGVGSKEARFIPAADKRKLMEASKDNVRGEGGAKRNRRSAKELRLKK